MFKLIPELISELILDRIDREIHSLKHLELKFGLSSEYLEFFNKISVRILLDVLFRVFRFSKASFYALTSSFITFLACVAGVRKGRGRGRELGRAPLVSLAPKTPFPKTPFPFPFKRLPRRL